MDIKILIIINLLLLIIVCCIEIYTVTENFNDLPSLDKISIEYSLDKSSHHHDYAVYYDKILSDLRNKKIRMIEIGIGTWEEGDSSMKYHWNNKNDPKKKNYKPGNSLRVWKKYFNNLDYILGIDVKQDCMFEEPNIKTELLDSTNTKSGDIIKKKYGGEFDVILDDGLHNISAQVKTFNTFWPLLKKEGIYLIEDIGNPDNLKSELEKHINKPIHIQVCKGVDKGIGDSNIIKIVK